MVKGLDLFTDYFRDYRDSYILIGGAATDIWMQEAGLPFRVTKDLDIILVIEALDEAFVQLFWKFIEEGAYMTRQKSDGKPKVYRFIAPEKEDFPVQVEIFSRQPDILGDFDGAHLAPIPLGEELGSLSAILMNDDYYSFARKNAEEINGLHLATTAALICLKAKAFLDIGERLEKADWANESEKSKLQKDHKKHKNDVIRIALILTGNDKTELPGHVKQDLQQFIEFAKADPPDYKQLAKNFGAGTIDPEQIFEQMNKTFGL